MSTCHLRVPCNSAAWEVYAMPSLHAISELAAHMACPHYMQAWNLHGICHAIIICKPWRLLDYMPYPHYMQFSSLLCTCHAIIIYNFWACGIYAMPSLHVILELMRHMPYQHFMQVWSGWGICHTIIEYIFWACEVYAIASTITVNYIVLVHITLYYIWLHCILSLTGPMSLKPWCLHDIFHILIAFTSGIWMGICYAIIACSSVACEICFTYCSMEFLSLWHMSHAIIICNPGACMANDMSPLYVILEYTGHMPCHN